MVSILLCFINQLPVLAKSSRFFTLTSLPSLKDLIWLYNFPFRFKSSEIGRSCSKQATN